jgi:hypothetical protein
MPTKSWAQNLKGNSHLEDLDMVGGIMLFIFCLFNDIVTQSDDTDPSDEKILNNELKYFMTARVEHNPLSTKTE